MATSTPAAFATKVRLAHHALANAMTHGSSAWHLVVAHVQDRYKSSKTTCAWFQNSCTRGRRQLASTCQLAWTGRFPCGKTCYAVVLNAATPGHVKPDDLWAQSLF